MPIDPNLGPVEKHGDEFSTPRIQEGAVLNEDGFGLRVLNGSYLVNDTDSTSTLTGSNLPKIGDEAIKGSGLFISKIAKRYKWDGMIVADFEAVGIDPAYNGITEIAFEGASTASAEPIESHPSFVTRLGGDKNSRLNGAMFDEAGKFLGFSTDITGTTVTNTEQSLAGVRSYLSPKDTGRGYIHFAANCGQVNNLLAIKQWLGYQSKGRTFKGVTLVPSWCVTMGSWLLTSASLEAVVTKKGGVPVIYKLSYEVTASGAEGWHNDIYTPID